MRLISHRGNINGPIPERENSPDYIDEAIKLDYEVEIDLWGFNKNKLYLGHDKPEYKIDLQWLVERRHNLWIHCKNRNSLYFIHTNNEFNYFFHENDKFTLTSKGYIWANIGKAVKNCIINQPEKFDGDFKLSIIQPLGICSDYIKNWENDKY